MVSFENYVFVLKDHSFLYECIVEIFIFCGYFVSQLELPSRNQYKQLGLLSNMQTVWLVVFQLLTLASAAPHLSPNGKFR